jgi:hypothetical protein
MPVLSYQETMEKSSPLVTEFLLPADAAGRLYELAQGDLEAARKLATLWDESNLRPDVFVRLVAELSPLLPRRPDPDYTQDHFYDPARGSLAERLENKIEKHLRALINQADALPKVYSRAAIVPTHEPLAIKRAQEVRAPLDEALSRLANARTLRLRSEPARGGLLEQVTSAVNEVRRPRGLG